VSDEFRRREAILTGTDPGPMLGIRYPGDDGTEPEEVRDRKAKEYADSVVAKANADAANGMTLSRNQRVERLARKMARWNGQDPDADGHVVPHAQYNTPIGVFTVTYETIKLWECYRPLASCMIEELEADQ